MENKKHIDYKIGKFYNVPCAKLVNEWGKLKCFVPVLGPPHNDKQFGFEETHYHIDGRFADNKNGFYNVDNEGKTNGIIQFGKPKTRHVIYYADEIVIKKKKCKRLTTGLKPPRHAKQYWDWRKSMVGKSCKGKKCPHLGQDMIEQNGVLICPLHNLVGCKTKMVIIE